MLSMCGRQHEIKGRIDARVCVVYEYPPPPATKPELSERGENETRHIWLIIFFARSVLHASTIVFHRLMLLTTPLIDHFPFTARSPHQRTFSCHDEKRHDALPPPSTGNNQAGS